MIEELTNLQAMLPAEYRISFSFEATREHQNIQIRIGFDKYNTNVTWLPLIICLGEGKGGGDAILSNASTFDDYNNFTTDIFLTL